MYRDPSLPSSSTGWLALAIALGFATGCAADGERVGPVLAETHPAAAGACLDGGREVRSGIDADEDGVLTETEVETTTLLCDDGALLLRDAAGDGCLAGGERIRAGVDSNGDGALDEAEVHAEVFVCLSGTPAETIVRTDSLEPGETCTDGGWRVVEGSDENGDGELSEDEVRSDQALCRHRVLQRMQDATEACVGGVRIDAGPDRDGDGELDEDEVRSSELLCGEVLEPGVSFEDAEFIDRFREVEHILGRLTIRSSEPLLELSFPNLRSVGELFITCSPEVPDCRVSFSADNLRVVRGELRITDVRMNALSLPALESVDSFRVDRVAGLERIEGPPGLRVATAISLQHNPDLVHIALNVGSGPRAVVAENPILSSLDLGGGGFAGSLEAYGNPVLATAVLRFWSSADGFNFTAPMLRSLEVHGARFGLEEMKLVRCHALPRIDLGEREAAIPVERAALEAPLTELPPIAPDKLTLVGTEIRRLDLGRLDRLHLTDNAHLEHVDVGEIVQSIGVVNSARLERITLATPLSGGQGVQLRDNPLLSEAPWVGDLEIVRSLTLVRNPNLPLPLGLWLRVENERFGRVELEGTSVELLHIEATTLTQLTLINNALTDVEVELWESEHLNVQVAENPDLTTLSVAGEIGFYDALDVGDNGSLRAMELPLPAVARSIAITNNPQLPACVAQRVLDRIECPDETQSGNDLVAACD